MASSPSDHKVLLVSTAVTVAILTTQYQRIYRAASSLIQRLYLNIVVLPRKVPLPSSKGTGAGMVTHLYIHPVKSLRAVPVDEAHIVERGFENDRRFMLITPAPTPIYGSFGPRDATHRFLTQRQCPSLATVTAKLEGTTLSLSTSLLPNERVEISTTPPTKAAVYRSTLWGDNVLVQDMGEEAAAFLNKVVSADTEVPDELKGGVRLVVQTKEDTRSVDEDFVPAAARTFLGKNPSVSLTDGYPILIACEASLQELNRRLKSKGKAELPMARFRPNIVIQGTSPFEEDDWKVIRIGEVILHVVKPCPRCKQSCTDQTTGTVTDEPLATMADFRALDPNNQGNLFFAQNAIPALGSVGQTIAVGAVVEVLQWGDPIYAD